MIDPKNPAPFYEQVADDLKQQIVGGAIAPNARLPSIADLGRHYNVSDITVRKAVDRLVREDLIFTRRGVGAFARERQVATKIRVFVPEGVNLGSAQFNAMAVLDNYAGIRRSARRLGCSVVTVGPQSRFHSRGGDGSAREGCVFLHDWNFVEQLDRISGLDVPYVVAEGLFEKYNRVSIDMEQGAVEAVEHLIALGHRKIAMLTDSADNPWYEPRIQGYRRALVNHDLPADPTFIAVCGDDKPAEVHRAVESLLSLSPTALFAGNDRRAVLAMEHLRRRGVSIPGDLSLVGYDNIPESAECEPALTTIDAPRERVGEEAVNLLLRIMDGQVARLPAVKVLAPSLVTRATTAPPR